MLSASVLFYGCACMARGVGPAWCLFAVRYFPRHPASHFTDVMYECRSVNTHDDGALIQLFANAITMLMGTSIHIQSALANIGHTQTHATHEIHKTYETHETHETNDGKVPSHSFVQSSIWKISD